MSRKPRAPDLVVEAIRQLRVERGFTPKEIINYIQANHNTRVTDHTMRRVYGALKKGADYGIFRKDKGRYALRVAPTMPMVMARRAHSEDSVSDCGSCGKRRRSRRRRSCKKRSRRRRRRSSCKKRSRRRRRRRRSSCKKRSRSRRRRSLCKKRSRRRRRRSSCKPRRRRRSRRSRRRCGKRKSIRRRAKCRC